MDVSNYLFFQTEAGHINHQIQGIELDFLEKG